jgi:hypothetical protein
VIEVREIETLAALCAVKAKEPSVYGTTWTSGSGSSSDADDR